MHDTESDRVPHLALRAGVLRVAEIASCRARLVSDVAPTCAQDAESESAKARIVPMTQSIRAFARSGLRLGVRSIAGAMRWWEPLSNLHDEPRPAGSGSHSPQRGTTGRECSGTQPSRHGSSNHRSLPVAARTCASLANRSIRPLLGPLWWLTRARLVKVLFWRGVSCRMPGPTIAAESASRSVCVERVHE